MKKITWLDIVVGAFLALTAFNGSPMTSVLCLIAFFLWLRVRPTKKIIAADEETDEDDNTHIVDDSEGDIISNHSVTLDTDINGRPSPGHFLYRHQYDISSGKCEYEYRIDGSKVFVRLLQDVNIHDTPSGHAEWDVRDGVVMEFDVRARAEEYKGFTGDVDKDIAAMKARTEWAELLAGHWRGLKFFILSKHLPGQDLRRALRAELERINSGGIGFMRELEKVGLEDAPDDALGCRRRPSAPTPSDEAVTKAWASLPSYGITQQEFYNRHKLAGMLRELLGEKP